MLCEHGSSRKKEQEDEYFHTVVCAETVPASIDGNIRQIYEKNEYYIEYRERTISASAVMKRALSFKPGVTS